MSVGISIVYNYVTVKHTKLFFLFKTNNNMYFIMHLLAVNYALISTFCSYRL